MQELFEAIGNFGFPIVVSGYLLMRHEQKMSDLKDAITGKDGIQDKIEELNQKIIECMKGKK